MQDGIFYFDLQYILRLITLLADNNRFRRNNCQNEKSIKMFYVVFFSQISYQTIKNILVPTNMNQGISIDQFLQIKKQRVFWSELEDQNLHQLVKQLGRNWNKISEILINRTPTQCSQRWKKIKPERVRAQNCWSKEEDGTIKKLISKHGQKWTKVANLMKTRTAQQIRDRYVNTLDPKIIKDPFSENEDQLIFDLYSQIGSKWSTISKSLPGRSPNCIKNRFNSYLKKFTFVQHQNFDVLPSDCTTQFMFDASIQLDKNVNEDLNESFENQSNFGFKHVPSLYEDNYEQNRELFL